MLKLQIARTVIDNLNGCNCSPLFILVSWWPCSDCVFECETTFYYIFGIFKASRLEIPIDGALSEADVKSQLLSKVDNSGKQYVQQFIDLIICCVVF